MNKIIIFRLSRFKKKIKILLFNYNKNILRKFIYLRHGHVIAVNRMWKGMMRGRRWHGNSRFIRWFGQR